MWSEFSYAGNKCFSSLWRDEAITGVHFFLYKRKKQIFATFLSIVQIFPQTVELSHSMIYTYLVRSHIIQKLEKLNIDMINTKASFLMAYCCAS